LNCAFFRGADGKFDLYEDEGDNYNYEQGAHALIPRGRQIRRADHDVGRGKAISVQAP
jgi:hypothetical protein